jgi:UDP-N-acetylmuramate dehydrogenase
MSYKKIDFSKYSSIKIGPELDVYILDACNTKGMKDAYLIGSCNNILVGDNPPPLMKLSKIYDYIKIEDNVLKIGGATPSGKIVSFCKKNNISDLEFLSHLPGTLGGLVYMNAGLKEYEIFNNLISINTCRGEFVKSEIEYGYRYTDIDNPILEATFALNTKGFSDLRVDMFKKMRSNQPSAPSAGSCFKNPKGDYAGRLIEAVGLKGIKKGDMEFSTEHANFLVNHGNGTYKDAIYLIKEAKRLVLEKFGIVLELEIQILDEEFITI